MECRIAEISVAFQKTLPLGQFPGFAGDRSRLGFGGPLSGIVDLPGKPFPFPVKGKSSNHLTLNPKLEHPGEPPALGHLCANPRAFPSFALKLPQDPFTRKGEIRSAFRGIAAEFAHDNGTPRRNDTRLLRGRGRPQSKPGAHTWPAAFRFGGRKLLKRVVGVPEGSFLQKTGWSATGKKGAQKTFRKKPGFPGAFGKETLGRMESRFFQDAQDLGKIPAAAGPAPFVPPHLGRSAHRQGLMAPGFANSNGKIFPGHKDLHVRAT